jgi:hypothetical protein
MAEGCEFRNGICQRAAGPVIGFAGVKSAALCPLVVAACLSGTILPACRDRKSSTQTVAGSKAKEHSALTRCGGDSGGRPSNNADVNLQSDRENCGECGRLCAPNSTCLNGTCPSYGRLVTRSLNTCLVRENGSIQCWSKLDEGSPVVVHDIDGIGPALEVQGDSMLICALSRKGHLNCWGENWGQIMKQPSLAPIPSLPTSVTVTQFSSHYFTCALLSDESVRCASPPQRGIALRFGEPLALGSDPPVGVSAGLVTCVLRRSGSVICYGEGGSGDFVRQGKAIDLGGKRAHALSTGERHACAVLEGERVVCWRDNQNRLVRPGQGLWAGAPSISDGPVEVSLGKVARIRGISAGDDHTCAWFEDGRLKCWGENDYGQLGLGDMVSRGTKPDQMGDRLPFVDLGRNAAVFTATTGATTTCALLSDGRVKCWGYAYSPVNAEGRIATGDQIPAIPLAP